jgi:hypothetical protein
MPLRLSPEINKIVIPAIPNCDACNSEPAVRDRTSDRMFWKCDSGPAIRDQQMLKEILRKTRDEAANQNK